MLLFFGGKSEAFKLSWPKGFQINNQNVWKIFSFNTKTTVQITKTFRCVHFRLVKIFLCKNSKTLGCANQSEWFSPDLCRFRSHLAQTRWPTACVRRSCEHARNVRTKNIEKTGSCKNRAKTRETCENSCPKKTLKKQAVRKSCENARNVRKSVRKTTIVRTVRTFHPNSTLGRILTKKIPNFAPKSAYSNFWPKIARVCAKNLNILFSDQKSPEFALKSAYWIFWPILARFSRNLHILSFSPKIAWVFPENCLFLTLTKARPALPSNLCILASAWKSPESAQKLLQSKLLTENHTNLHISTFCLECVSFVTAIHTLTQMTCTMFGKMSK